MNLNEYQSKALYTDVFVNKQKPEVLDPAFMSKILGLSGEAGEVMEKFKKIIRDKNGKITESDKVDITRELGDVLWYIAVISSYMDVKFDDLAKINLDKLADRHSRNKIQASGDNR